MTIEELQVLITANTTALQKEIAKTNTVVNSLKKSADKTQSGVTSAFKKLKRGIAALGIGKIIKESIQSGMDAVESDSLFETSLGNMADSVRSWSDEVADALGLNAITMRKNTGVIYNMTSSMGVAEENALKMSKGISLLTEDMASFYNLDSTEAFNKLRAGLTGETEPLKALGILVDENTIKQVAYSEGIATTGSELTQQQKVLARYVAILKQTGNAQGDLARTLDSPANQLRLLKSQVQQLGLAFSNFLLPVVSAVLPYLTAFTKVVTSALNSLSKFLGLQSTSATDETSKVSANVGSIADGLDDANSSAKSLKNTLAGFDEMNVLSDNSTSDSSSTGTSVGGIDFDLSEYDAHLDWVSSKTDAIAEQIKNAFSKVGKSLEKIWNSKPVQAYINLITTSFGFVKDTIVRIGTDIYNNLDGTWGNIKNSAKTSFDNISEFFTTMWTDMANGIDTWGQPILDGISGLFNSMWETVINPALQIISNAWADFSGILVELWNEHGQPLIDNIGEFVSNVIGLFQKIYDDILEPIITPLLEQLSWLWNEHLSGMVEKLGDFIGKWVNGALELYNKFFSPIVNFLLDYLSPAWSQMTSFVTGVLGTLIGAISDVVSGIFEFFGGVIDFITGIFTGNWEKAWNGVKSAFKGIFDSLIGIFKIPINLIIDGINSFIAGLNKIKIPDWVPAVGGKGIDIPKIPKLAQGGVVDKPTYAMIGEAGAEAVMPLENNTGWMDKLADKLGSKIGTSGDTPIQLTVKIGEDTIMDKVIKGIKDKEFETNGVVFV